ncbi:alpha-L-fucosidase [Sphingobacterium spiritivorum]|uniref:alpha-L-fucosidase n=1 Tax=Sphingobacterium spiritivorum ATCC 33861 TaxID=525373 RepID=D7VKY6_SPHSI|nr:alpha-L-fucosidase [Sphingobacterium spiritivorum]EFK58259.1 F5/8 type C domain protein [Sphingobacterium spiritivorum ATCC 33861]QQT37018.1 alpha-L-fucosidase [Sphingobacterium spiritivorum]WQD33786.1 alpha-L-fucosidase [Sphingobacterium spiritivorum]SUJ27233.1 Alpha-L-fucosidase [Sphingobacterium spiritivorum]
MKFTNLIGALLLPACLIAQQEPKPYGAIPSERQLKWHEMEMYSLVHFTPTTFQNKEWGYGDAPTSLFNPSDFSADQIAQAAASAGFKGLISVAKHHDGFCLWPTATTTYNIASTPWKNGKGDMVKEFMNATHRAGMKFGVYLSAWDRNDTRYGTPAYADAYREQLRELMSNYGELFTSWHDGANGGDGYYGGRNEKRVVDRTTYYAWEEKTWPIVRKLQPMAMIFSDVGPDMRWVGNEHGFAAETSWATITPKSLDGKKPVPGVVDDSNLPTGDRDGKYWIPAECDVPQRPGWFYHADQNDKVKTPNQLFEIYLKSVGRGANMNLGLAPMPSGQLHENDVRSLAAFGKKITETFHHNLIQGAKLKASNVRGKAKLFKPENVLDNDRYSYWATEDNVHNPTLEIELQGEKEFNLIRLRENIKLGQRVDSVFIEVWAQNKWTPLARATSIGSTRLIKLDKPVKAGKLRLHLYAPVAPALSDFGLFKEFDEPFTLSAAAVKTLSATQYTVHPAAGLDKAFDGNPQTFGVTKDADKGIIFEVNAALSGLGYLPRQDGSTEGLPTKYEIYTSDNNKDWKLIQSGEFANIKANPILQKIFFDKPVHTKYLKFIPKETLGNTFSAAGFELYTP